MSQYSMEIKNSQANYSFIVSVVEEGGGQSSNYVGIKFFNDALNKNILVKTDIGGYPRSQDDVYELNREFKFKLGPEVLKFIGDEYNNFINKFIISYPNTKDGKPQLNRKVYKKLSERYDGFSWFVELYDKNISGNKLLITVDEDEKLVILDVEFSSIKEFITFKSKSPIKDIPCPQNRIVFGAPGTGKSFQLEKDRKQYFGNRYIRVTFHPNYSYSHFVGTYKPVPETYEDENGDEKEGITYKYVPGPFMEAFVEAINNPDENFLLLIEEINRANVAAVFGDVFQLLDRKKDGESEYEIQTSKDMKDYLHDEIDDENYDSERIKIPNNLYIWATMNSADQGVFPMDTAFKRRWDFSYIGINDNDGDMKNIWVELGKDKKKVCWNDLRIAINNILSNECHINEDKLIGPYFISKDVLESEKMKIEEDGVSEEKLFVKDNDKFIETFKYKLLMYLYEDVAKQQHVRSKLFAGCDDYSKFSSLRDEFDVKGEEIFGKNFIEGNVD